MGRCSYENLRTGQDKSVSPTIRTQLAEIAVGKDHVDIHACNSIFKEWRELYNLPSIMAGFEFLVKEIKKKYPEMNPMRLPECMHTN